MTGGKLNHSDALDFIFAGKAHVTFVNTRTGNRFTFKVKKKKKAKDEVAPDIFFVSVLTGTSEYTFIGSVIDSKYRHSKKSKIGIDAQSVKVFKFVLSQLLTNTLPDFIEVWHEGCCGRCGRRLTVPISIVTGFGPECVKLVAKTKQMDREIKFHLLGI